MTVPVSDADGSAAKVRDSRTLALAEFAIVILLFVADVYRLIPVSKTPFLVALAWFSLRVRNADWRSLGWATPQSWVRAISFGVIAGVTIEWLELLVTHPFLSWLMGRPPDLSDFRPLVGNLRLVFVTLPLIWVVAAVGEEVTGMLENVVAGFLLGVLYLRSGCNLTVPIIAHGVQDTVDVVLIFLGRYPGM
jgi:uncharacterized protein